MAGPTTARRRAGGGVAAGRIVAGVAQLVRMSTEGPVATVVVENPPMNTLADDTLAQLAEICAEVANRAEVRAVVLTGAGERAFASGADLREFTALFDRPGAIERHVDTSRRAFTALTALPQPVVAAVQAAAVGGGLELALACDVIVADERAQLGLPEVRLGLIPGAGGTQRLPRRVGLARATQLVLTGTLLSAGDALELGLVDEVAPQGRARDHAETRAAAFAAQPAHAIQAAKRAVRDGAELPLAAGLDLERQAFVGVFNTSDAREGVTAFLERRTPAFGHIEPEPG